MAKKTVSSADALATIRKAARELGDPHLQMQLEFYDRDRLAEAFFTEGLSGTEQPDEFSNVLRFWDQVPKYYVSSSEKEKMRARANGRLESISRTFRYRGSEYRVTLLPAKLSDFDGEDEDFPGETEELIEETLRYMFVTSPADNRWHDSNGGSRRIRELVKQSGDTSVIDPRALAAEVVEAPMATSTGLFFSQRQLREQLQSRGHTRSATEINRALAVLSRTTVKIEITQTNPKTQETEKTTGEYRILNSLVKNERGSSDYQQQAVYMAEFNMLLNRAIADADYRKIDHSKLMSIRRPIGRWLYRRLAVNFVNAGSRENKSPAVLEQTGGEIVVASPVTHTLYLATLERDSGLLNSKESRHNHRTVTQALDELIALKVIADYKVEDIRRAGVRGIADRRYELLAHEEFAKETKLNNASEKRRKASIAQAKDQADARAELAAFTKRGRR